MRLYSVLQRVNRFTVLKRFLRFFYYTFFFYRSIIYGTLKLDAGVFRPVMADNAKLQLQAMPLFNDSQCHFYHSTANGSLYSTCLRKENGMKHIIADKLDFLMKVTKTKNNMLSRALAFDASHISRIRTGQRGLPSSREFILPAASYFARAVQTASQKRIIARHICPGSAYPDTLEGATLLLANWLGEGEPIDYAALNQYLEETALTASPDFAATGTLQNGSTMYFMGNEGKRQCVLRFLTDLAGQNEPVTLLLHSEENMQWIYEKPEFARQWGQLLVTLLKRGGKIIIVHSVNRSFEEMVEAVAKWSPLYASGTIIPYYYPRLRDNVFRRTLFIARGKAAILAHTTGNPGVNRLNILTSNVPAVKALEQEFDDFLSMCRPLMQTFTGANFRTKIIPVLGAFRKAKSELVHFHTTPSVLTMPETVLESLSRRPGCARYGDYLTNHNRLLFRRGTALANDVTDILYLPEISAVLEGKAPVPLAAMFGLPPQHYTAEEYLLHLCSTLQWMQTSKAYRVVLLMPGSKHPATGSALSAAYSLVSSLQAGVMLYSTQSPSTLFYTREQAMTSSFWEYLDGIIKNAAPREETLTKLQQYIDMLKKAME